MSALPELLDRKTLAKELGVPRSTVDAIFRQLPVVTFADPTAASGRHRKVFVKRADVAELIERGTYANDGIKVRR